MTDPGPFLAETGGISPNLPVTWAYASGDCCLVGQ